MSLKIYKEIMEVFRKSICTALMLAGVLLITACNSNSDDAENKNLPNPFVDSTKLDEKITSFMQQYSIPGLSVALISNPGEPIIWTKGYGVADIESGTPVTANTSFWLASVSKAVLGTIIMIAQEHGSLSLSDSVQMHLTTQNQFTIDNPGSASITLQHLVTHTSGIVDNATYYSCAYYIPDELGGHQKLANLVENEFVCPESSPIDLAGFLSAYLNGDGQFYSKDKNFLTNPPGERQEYSNVGAALAGYMTELAVGQDLATYAQQKIFEPLEMSHTSWKYSDLSPENIATPYIFIDAKLIAIPNYELATWPDGGLRSSSADLSHFLATIMNHGQYGKQGEQILSAENINQLLKPIFADLGVFWSQVTLAYGGKEHIIIGHGGSDPGAFSFMFFNPERETGIVIIANGDDQHISATDMDALLAFVFESAESLQENTD